MTSISLTFPNIDECPLKLNNPIIHQRTSARHLRSSRAELSPSKSKRNSKEPKEDRSVGKSDSVKTKHQALGSSLPALSDSRERSEDEFPEGVTLDKIFGGTYKKIDLNSTNNTEDLFPTMNHRMRRSIVQENFEIKETDNEDEDNSDSRIEDSVGEINKKAKGIGMESVKELATSVIISSSENKGLKTIENTSRIHSEFENTVPTEFSPWSRPKNTISIIHRKEKGENSEESFSRLCRVLEESKPSPGKSTFDHGSSKSPSRQNKKRLSVQPKESRLHHCPEASPIKSKKRNSIEDIKHVIEDAKRKELMNQTLTSQVHSINLKEGANNSNFFGSGLYSSGVQFEPLDIKGYKELETLDEKRLTKRNKFNYQKAVLNEKIKDEEKMLLTKYGAKFGINVQDYYGKPQSNIPANSAFGKHNANLDTNKRACSPFIRIETSYRPVGSGKGVLY